MDCRARAAPRARHCRSTHPRCSTSPTTHRSAGTIRICALSSSKCAGRCSMTIRASSGWQGGERELERNAQADAALARSFAAAFPGDAAPVTMDNVIRAIAAYERTLLSGSAPFDRYVFAGDHGALSERQKAGMQLFFSQRTGCAGCHSGINFNGEWVDREHPEATADICRHGHRGGGARAHAAQPPGDRALHARRPVRHAGCRARSLRAAGHRPESGRSPAPRATNYRRAATIAGIPAFARGKSLSHGNALAKPAYACAPA